MVTMSAKIEGREPELRAMRGDGALEKELESHLGG